MQPLDIYNFSTLLEMRQSMMPYSLSICEVNQVSMMPTTT